MYDNDSGGGDGNHMTEMLEWVKQMIFLGIFLTLLLQVLPANAYRKYVRFFAGMVFVVTILNPLFSVLGTEKCRTEVGAGICPRRYPAEQAAGFFEYGTTAENIL